jgi:hypothetical protein
MGHRCHMIQAAHLRCKFMLWARIRVSTEQQPLHLRAGACLNIIGAGACPHRHDLQGVDSEIPIWQLLKQLDTSHW